MCLTITSLQRSKEDPINQERFATPPSPDIRIPAWVPLVFCTTGFAALLYQVVWQRVLYSTFGVNVEAVTTIVTAFLAGLGVGSLAGGRLARGPNHKILLFCGLIEIAIGIFGVWSLSFFRWIGNLTLGLPVIPRGVTMALVVMFPTTLMGATLPLLVAFLVRSTGNVGGTVGLLYFVNTAGSAFAAIAAVLLILGNLGEGRSAYLAAGLNFLVGAFILVGPLRRSPRS
jgi:predicted membrane-bound spermidine synthase